MPESQLSAIVLAAGSSSRMASQNKLLLDFRGKALVAHIVETIVAAGFAEVLVVVGHDANRVRHSLTSYPVSFVDNEAHSEGMSSSIRAGVSAASHSTAGFLICLADLPLIEPAEFRALGHAFDVAVATNPQAIVVPVHDGQRGNPVAFSAHYRDQILAQNGPMGCRAIVNENGNHVSEVEMETNHVLLDIDTPDAYNRLQ